MRVVDGVSGNQNDNLDDIVAGLADNDNNDTNVPSSAVIQATLGFNVADVLAEVNMAIHCVDSMEKGPGDLLVAAGKHEDIWSFINFDACM